LIWADALAVLLELVVDAALMVHVPADAGAVNNPALVMAPHDVDQVTD
jgi:hypothetical protein